MKVLEKKISVIIPVYNAEKYISETLDSIIKQSYKNREIILVENGSKDRSSGILFWLLQGMLLPHLVSSLRSHCLRS